MVNSSSFDAANNNTGGDRNGAKQARSTQGHETQAGSQSASPVTAATATSCETGTSHAAADNSLPCVDAAAIETSTSKTNSGDGTMISHDNPDVNDSESTADDKSTFCSSVPLEKVQGVLPTHSKLDIGSTLERGKSKPKLLCLFCDRSFGSANLRQKHVERVHSAKQNRRISSRRQNMTSTPCIHCDKMSDPEHTLNDLFRHMVAEHPTKYFGCLPCEDRFLSLVHLSDHNSLQHPDSIENSINSSTVTSDDSTSPSIELVIAPFDSEDTTPQKVTRSRLKPKVKDPLSLHEEDEFKRPADVRRKRSNLKEVKNKTLTLKPSKVVLKRSKRLQAQVKEVDSEKRRTSKRIQKTSESESVDCTKSPGKSKLVSINPYPEFDGFYRIKKITDHSIDNLKISSLTFDDVFDKAFFNRIKCNIEDNLLHHIDGKLFKNEESESRISNFEKVGSQTVQSSSTENYGCDLTLNAITPVASLSLNSQYGEDFESQIEYGSKPSKKKTTPVKKDEILYKYFTRRKYQASILEQKENRDLSRLDMWTQLLIKERQQNILNDKRSPKEFLEYTSGKEYKSKLKREELDRILDRRGPFEDLKEEISKQAAFDKLNSTSDVAVSAEVFTIVREVVNDILSRVLESCEEEQIIVTADKQPDDRLVPAHLNLRRTSSLPEEEIDKSDRIALICSSQETENFELPTNKARRKDEAIELTGEWARSRIYICAACGDKFPNIKFLLEHKSVYHPNVWVQHYEFVGNQSELYRHLSIPGLGKMGIIEEKPQCKQWQRSDARSCAKCKKQCNSLGELHRHVLECGGDWTWILARKKCKYRPFGAKSRRKRRGFVTRIRRKEKTDASDAEKKIYKYGPRSKPSDAETIQRMLANLPAKRSRRSFVSLRDVIFKSRKRKENTILQSQDESSETTLSSKLKPQHSQRLVNLPSIKRSLRSINKVLSSTILDSSLIRVKRKIKLTNEQRITRQSQKDSGKSEKKNVTNSVVESTAKTLKKTAKDNDPLIVSNTLVQNKIARKRILNSRLNIKNFFPVKKRSNRRNVESEIIANPVSIRPTRNIPSIEKVKETRQGGGLKGLVRNLRKKNNSPVEEKTPTSSTRRTKLTRQLSRESVSSDKSSDKNVKSTKDEPKSKTDNTSSERAKNIVDKPPHFSVKEKIANKIKEKRCLKKIKPLENKSADSNPKNKNLKKRFQSIINNVKNLKLDGADAHDKDKTYSNLSNIETVVNPHSIFLEKGISEKAESSVTLKETISPLEAKKEDVLKESFAPAVTNLIDTKENPPIPEKMFNLEPGNEELLQAKGELNFDQKVDINPLSSISKTSPAASNMLISSVSNMLSINIDSSDKPKSLISPSLISPSLKGKIRKPAKGLNDCIAMLTSKLQQKEVTKLSPLPSPSPKDTNICHTQKVEEKSVDLLPSPKLDLQPQKAECILRIPTFKVTTPMEDNNDTALDLSKKPTENSFMKNNSDTSVYFEPPKELQLSEFGSTLNKVIGDVIEHNCKEVLSEKLTSHGWTSVNDIIQKVINSESKNLTRKSAECFFPKSSVDDSIEAVIRRFSLDSDNLLFPSNEISKKKGRPTRKKSKSRKDLSNNSFEITLTSLLQDSEIISKPVKPVVLFPQKFVPNVEPKVLEISTVPCVPDDHDELDIERLIPETKLQRILPGEDITKTENLMKPATVLPNEILSKGNSSIPNFVEEPKNTLDAKCKADEVILQSSTIAINLNAKDSLETSKIDALSLISPGEVNLEKTVTVNENKQMLSSDIDENVITKIGELVSKNNKVKTKSTLKSRKTQGRRKKGLPSESNINVENVLNISGTPVQINSINNSEDSISQTNTIGPSDKITFEENVLTSDLEDDLPLVDLAKTNEIREVDDKQTITDEDAKDTGAENVTKTSTSTENKDASQYLSKKVHPKVKTKKRNKFAAKTFMKRPRKKKAILATCKLVESAIVESSLSISTENDLTSKLNSQESNISTEKDEIASPNLEERAVTEPLDSSTPILANKSHTRRKSKTMKKIDKVDNELFKDFTLVINKKTKRIPPTSIVDDSVCDDSMELPIKSSEPIKQKCSEPDDSVQEMDMEIEEIPFNSAIIERIFPADTTQLDDKISVDMKKTNQVSCTSKIPQDGNTENVEGDNIVIVNHTKGRKKGKPGRKPKNNAVKKGKQNIQENLLNDKIEDSTKNLESASQLASHDSISEPQNELSQKLGFIEHNVSEVEFTRKGRKPRATSKLLDFFSEGSSVSTTTSGSSNSTVEIKIDKSISLGNKLSSQNDSVEVKSKSKDEIAANECNIATGIESEIKLDLENSLLSSPQRATRRRRMLQTKDQTQNSDIIESLVSHIDFPQINPLEKHILENIELSTQCKENNLQTVQVTNRDLSNGATSTSDDIIENTESHEDLKNKPLHKKKRRGRKPKVIVPTEQIENRGDIEDNLIDFNKDVSQNKLDENNSDVSQVEGSVLDNSLDLKQISEKHLNGLFHSIPYVELSNDFYLNDVEINIADETDNALTDNMLAESCKDENNDAFSVSNISDHTSPTTRTKRGCRKASTKVFSDSTSDISINVQPSQTVPQNPLIENKSDFAVPEKVTPSPKRKGRKPRTISNKVLQITNGQLAEDTPLNNRKDIEESLKNDCLQNNSEIEEKPSLHFDVLEKISPKRKGKKSRTNTNKGLETTNDSQFEEEGMVLDKSSKSSNIQENKNLDFIMPEKITPKHKGRKPKIDIKVSEVMDDSRVVKNSISLNENEIIAENVLQSDPSIQEKTNFNVFVDEKIFSLPKHAIKKSGSNTMDDGQLADEIVALNNSEEFPLTTSNRKTRGRKAKVNSQIPDTSSIEDILNENNLKVNPDGLEEENEVFHNMEELPSTPHLVMRGRKSTVEIQVADYSLVGEIISNGVDSKVESNQLFKESVINNIEDVSSTPSHIKRKGRKSKGKFQVADKCSLGDASNEIYKDVTRKPELIEDNLTDSGVCVTPQEKHIGQNINSDFSKDIDDQSTEQLIKENTPTTKRRGRKSRLEVSKISAVDNANFGETETENDLTNLESKSETDSIDVNNKTLDTKDKGNALLEKSFKKSDKLKSIINNEPMIYKNIFEEIEEKPSRTRSKSKAILEEQLNVSSGNVDTSLKEKSVYDFEDTEKEEEISLKPNSKTGFETPKGLSRRKAKSNVTNENRSFQETSFQEPKNCNAVIEKDQIGDISETNLLKDFDDKLSNNLVFEEDMLSKVKLRVRNKSKNKIPKTDTLYIPSPLTTSISESDYQELKRDEPILGKSKRGRKKVSLDSTSLNEHPAIDDTKDVQLSTNLSKSRKKCTLKRSRKKTKSELNISEQFEDLKQSNIITVNSLLMTRGEITESDLDKQADEEVASLTCGHWNSTEETDLDESRRSSLSDKVATPIEARSPSLSPHHKTQEVPKIIDIVPVLNESSDIFDLIKKKPTMLETTSKRNDTIIPEISVELEVPKISISQILMEPKVPKLSMRELRKSKGLLVEEDRAPCNDKPALMDVSQLINGEISVSEDGIKINSSENLHSIAESSLILEDTIEIPKIKNRHNKKHDKKNKVDDMRENVLKLFNSNTNLDLDALKSSLEKMAAPVLKNKHNTKDIVAEIEPLTDILTSSDMDIAPVIDEIDKSLEMDDIYDFEDDSEPIIMNAKKIELREESLEKFELHRRTSTRTAKSKALENIHDEALASIFDDGIHTSKQDTNTKMLEKIPGKKGSRKNKNQKSISDVSSNNDLSESKNLNMIEPTKDVSEKNTGIKEKPPGKKSKKTKSEIVLQQNDSNEISKIFDNNEELTKANSQDLSNHVDESTSEKNKTDINSICVPQNDAKKFLDTEKDNCIINAHLGHESNSEETLWNKMFEAAKTQSEILKSPEKILEDDIVNTSSQIIAEPELNLEEIKNKEEEQNADVFKNSFEKQKNADISMNNTKPFVRKKPGRKSKKEGQLLEKSSTKELELIENNPDLVESLKENQIISLPETENRNIILEDKADNQELRRSRRGSQKIISYNENDLIDPVIELYEKKRQMLHVKKDKVSDKKPLDDFDSMKSSTNCTTLSASVESQASKQRVVKSDLVDNIYEFTDSPENDEIVTESISVLRKSKTKQQETVPEGNADSHVNDANADKNDKFKTPVSSVYCDICKKTFQRIENLIKHKTTLTHISKLSELEAKEAERRNKEKELIESQNSVPITVDRDNINITDILETEKSISNKEQTSFLNNETLQLEDIINEVLNKPVLKPDSVDEPKASSYSIYNAESDSELETLKLKSKENYSPTLTKTIAEKQISLLENIIEKTGGNLLGSIFESSNHEDSDDDLRDSSSVGDALSSYKDTSVLYNKHDEVLKPVSLNVRPDHYEEISEDSTSLSTFDDQKARKTLNRDEELFLECCSLLKSGSEVSNFSKNDKGQKAAPKILDAVGTRHFQQPKEDAHEYSDNSRTPTPLGDTFDDNASGSNSIVSEWNPQPVDNVGKNFTFKEALSGELLSVLSKGSNDADNKFEAEVEIQDRVDNYSSITPPESLNEDNNKKDPEEILPAENKKIITKGARKVFEGLKISIPTEDLDLDIINYHKNDKSDKLIESPGKSKPRKSKPTKKSQVGGNVLFKAKKNKSPLTPFKTNDVYKFEETQEPSEIFSKPNLGIFSFQNHNKDGENENDSNNFEDSNGAEADLVSNNSSYSLLSAKKCEPIVENITKKKSKVMSKIFKNAAKSRLDEIESEMRDIPEIPEIDNIELVENYVLSCSQMTDREDEAPSDKDDEKEATPPLDEAPKTKMTEQEIDELFDQLIGKKTDEKPKEAKPKTKSTKSKSDTINKKTETKKTEVKNGETKKKHQKSKGRKRTRSDSETDAEFNLSKTKKQSRKKKEEDNVINLEQELRECIGVASRKSQRSCTSGKQNVLTEYWSSDDEAFEKMLQAQNNKKPVKPSKKSLTKEELLSKEIEKTLDSASESSTIKDNKENSIDEGVEEDNLKSKPVEKKKPGRRKKPSNKPEKIENQDESNLTTETITALNRRKRVASNPLYHWSSSSEEDEPESMVEITSIRQDEEDDHPIQHGWIVGNSPKKLVTMLALTKGKKTEVDCVKEQNKKKTSAVS